MDIKQAVDARAAITLGKDMSWRDYCQVINLFINVNCSLRMHCFAFKGSVPNARHRQGPSNF